MYRYYREVQPFLEKVSTIPAKGYMVTAVTM